MPAALQAEQEAEQQVEPVGSMAQALRQQADHVEHFREEVVKAKRNHKPVSAWLRERASMDPQALRDYADRLEAGTLSMEISETHVTVTYCANLVEGEAVVAGVGGDLMIDGTYLEELDLDDLREDGELMFGRIDYAGTRPHWMGW